VTANDTPAAGEPARVSTLKWILLVCLAFFLRYFFQGYIVYRGDQLVHVPLLWVLQDPSLFPHDPFLHEFSMGNLRYFYLLLLQSAGAIFGLPFGLFVLYAAFYGLTIWAWFCISKKVFESYAPGFFFALILAFHTAGEIAGNNIIESQILPRSVGLTACWWALYFVCLPNARLGALWAGLVLAAGTYFHLLVPVQFWPALCLWILVKRRREGIAPVVILTAVFVAIVAPSLLKTREVIGSYASSSDPNSLLLWAYVRAPHHMALSTWGSELTEFAALLALWAVVWWPMRRTRREGWQLGLLSVVILAILVVAAVVIVVRPSEKALLAQPFRLSVPMRAAMYLVIAHHLAGLAKRRTFWAFVRAAALVVCGLERELFLCVMVGETAVVLLERRGLPLPVWTDAVVLLAALAVACVWKSESRNPTLLAMGSAIVAYWAVARPSVGAWLTQWGLPAAVSVGAVFFAAMWFLPFEKWVGDPEPAMQRRLARFCFDHALRPFPIAAIEKVGAWAERNAAKDALFLIPPEKGQAGFHPWAKRSVVFTVKYFPYSRAGVREWKERYLAVRGLTEANPAAEVEAALRDLGAKGTGADYENLSVEKVLTLAKKYGAGYVVSEHDPPYKSDELAVVFEARDSDSRRSKPLRVYRVLSTLGK